MISLDHNFADDLAFSHSCQAAPWWEVCYRKFFPTMKGMQDVREDGPRQRQGVDRIVVLAGGRIVQIDEKARRKTYPDILVEIIADQQRGTPGWACKDLIAEHIAYAKVPLKRCSLLPVVPLQTAFRRYGDQWQARYGTRVAYNKDRLTNRQWTTVSIPVPDAVLFDCIQDVLTVSWEDQPQQAPSQASNGGLSSTAFRHQLDLFGRQ